MVKKIFIATICIGSVAPFHFSNAQTMDTVKCNEYFEYFNDLYKNQIVTLWSQAPSLKETNAPVLSNLCDLVSENDCEHFVASLILNKNGRVVCIKTHPKIMNDSLMMDIENLLYKLEFEPAIGYKDSIIAHYILVLNTQKCKMYKDMN